MLLKTDRLAIISMYEREISRLEQSVVSAKREMEVFRRAIAHEQLRLRGGTEEEERALESGEHDQPPAEPAEETNP